MNLVSIGISHRTAAVDIRERMWLSDEEARQAVAQLKDRFFSECMLVSTCMCVRSWPIVNSVGAWRLAATVCPTSTLREMTTPSVGETIFV